MHNLKITTEFEVKKIQKKLTQSFLLGKLADMITRFT